eukprot:Sro98_g050480.1 n/a (610) ;mRNA; r:58925-60754
MTCCSAAVAPIPTTSQPVAGSVTADYVGSNAAARADGNNHHAHASIRNNPAVFGQSIPMTTPDVVSGMYGTGNGGEMVPWTSRNYADIPPCFLTNGSVPHPSYHPNSGGLLPSDMISQQTNRPSQQQYGRALSGIRFYPNWSHYEYGSPFGSSASAFSATTSTAPPPVRPNLAAPSASISSQPSRYQHEQSLSSSGFYPGWSKFDYGYSSPPGFTSAPAYPNYPDWSQFDYGYGSPPGFTSADWSQYDYGYGSPPGFTSAPAYPNIHAMAEPIEPPTKVSKPSLKATDVKQAAALGLRPSIVSPVHAVMDNVKQAAALGLRPSIVSPVHAVMDNVKQAAALGLRPSIVSPVRAVMDSANLVGKIVSFAISPVAPCGFFRRHIEPLCSQTKDMLQSLQSCLLVSKIWNQAAWEAISPGIDGVITSVDLVTLKKQIARLNLSTLLSNFRRDFLRFIDAVPLDFADKWKILAFGLFSIHREAKLTLRAYKHFLLVKAVEWHAARSFSDTETVQFWKQECKPCPQLAIFWKAHMSKPRKYSRENKLLVGDKAISAMGPNFKVLDIDSSDDYGKKVATVAGVESPLGVPAMYFPGEISHQLELLLEEWRWLGRP